MSTQKLPGAIITFGHDWKAGDQPPEGYLDWHEWAEVQHKAGLRQKTCGRCGKWKFPQELSGANESTRLRDRYGKLTVVKSAICNQCRQPR